MAFVTGFFLLLLAQAFLNYGEAIHIKEKDCIRIYDIDFKPKSWSDMKGLLTKADLIAKGFSERISSITDIDTDGKKKRMEKHFTFTNLLNVVNRRRLSKN